MPDADAFMGEQRFGRQARWIGTPPLLRASDDVLIMILEKTSAIDVARMLRLNKALRRKISTNLDRIARSLIKPQRWRLARDGIYLDFSKIDIAHAVGRYVKFFEIDGRRTWQFPGWPKWYLRFCDLYGSYLADESPDLEVAITQARAVYLLNIVQQTRLALDGTTDVESLLSSAGYLHWCSYLGLPIAALDIDAYKDELSKSYGQKPGQDSAQLRAMFEYVGKADVFNTKNVTVHKKASVSARKAEGYAQLTGGGEKDKADAANRSQGLSEHTRDAEDDVEGDEQQEGGQARDDNGEVEYGASGNISKEAVFGPLHRIISVDDWRLPHSGHHMLITAAGQANGRALKDDSIPLKYCSRSKQKSLGEAAQREYAAVALSSKTPNLLLLAAVMEDAEVCQVYEDGEESE